MENIDMERRANTLMVKHGSIYNKQGLMIDNMAIIVDKTSGLSKYGDSSTNSKEYFESIVQKYKNAGFDDVADDLLYVEFDRYKGALSIEEVCTLVNYMSMTSANGARIMELISMDVVNLKKEIDMFKKIGY